MSWVFILAYLLIQLGIGYWVSLRIQNEDDYFLAGRNLGAFAISFSLFATWFGAETCIGSAGAIYEIGLAGGRADPFGYALNFFILGFLIATPLWKGGHKTLADFFKASYGPTLEKVVVWVLLPSSVIWAAAQIKAFGEVISATSPLNVEVAVTIAAAFVIVYTFLGGLLGDIITDILQGGILLIILVITLFVTVDYLGGWATTIDLIDPQRLSLMRDDESFLEKFDRWMIPVIGAVMTQELIARVLAAKNVSVARKSSFIAGGMYLSLGAIPAFLGLIGPKVIPGIDSVESYLPMLAQTVLPQYLYILFSGALISAILSTVDSILLAQSALVTHNFLVPVFKITDEKKKVFYGRLCVVIAGVLAYILALHAGRIYDLVIYAESLGSAGVVAITAIALIWKKGHEKAAILALVIGLIAVPINENLLELQAPFVSAIIMSLISYLIGVKLSNLKVF